MASNTITLPSISCYICHDTTDYKINRSCRRCGRPFCTAHSSKINPVFCEYCLINIELKEETYQRVDKEWDEKENKEIIIKSPVARKISYSGPDWAFYQEVWCNFTSDEEAKAQIEFFKTAISLLETELTSRKINKTAVIRLNSGVYQTQSTVTKTVTRTRPKQPVDLAALVEKFKKVGLTKEQITQMILQLQQSEKK